MNSVIPAGTDWHSDFQEWLRPFLAVFKRSEKRCWVPLYLEGLLGPGVRKSVEPIGCSPAACAPDSAQLNVVEEALKNAHLDPALLELEVTESTFLDQDPGSIRLLNAMCDMGIRIAIDDFGTGYSNLAYLKQLPVDVLKIDQSFVRGLPLQSNDREIVTAIIALAKSLGLAVTAEGVETAEQKDMLKALGCDDFQGFSFSQPLSAGQFAQMLRSDLL